MLLLTEQQKDFCKAISDFCEAEITPNLQEWDEKNEFPDEAYKKANALGFNIFEFPEEAGGLGLDKETCGVIYEKLGYYDSGIALTCVTTNLAWKPVLFAGNLEQKKLFVNKVKEVGYASFALTEPGGGSDVASTRTRAVKDGNEWVINGTKCFITNGGYAGVYVVFASTDPSKGAHGISAFLVEGDRPGITRGKEENKMGIRTTNTVELAFEDLRVPEDHLLGKEGEGMKYAMLTLDLARPYVAAIATGMAQRALDEAVKYSKERVVFGRQINKFQALQFMMADMDMKIETARQMYRHVIDLASKDIPYTKEAAISKAYCTDICVDVCCDAIQIMGGFGYMKDYPVEKIFRDAKSFQIFEGTNQIQRTVIAKQLLK